MDKPPISRVELWLLTHLPRPVVLVLISSFIVVVVSLIVFGIVLVVAIGIFCFFTVTDSIGVSRDALFWVGIFIALVASLSYLISDRLPAREKSKQDWQD